VSQEVGYIAPMGRICCAYKVSDFHDGGYPCCVWVMMSCGLGNGTNVLEEDGIFVRCVGTLLPEDTVP
jgi:hypothetical protein